MTLQLIAVHLPKGDMLLVQIMGSNTSSRSNNFVFTNNTMTSAGYYGLQLYYLSAHQLLDNHITLASNGYAGMYMYYCSSSSTAPSRINRNQIYKSDYYGIYMSSCDNPSTQKGGVLQ